MQSIKKIKLVTAIKSENQQVIKGINIYREHLKIISK